MLQDWRQLAVFRATVESEGWLRKQIPEEMPNRVPAGSGPRMVSRVSYELHLVRTVGKLFGKKKAFEFAFLLPLVLASKKNRSAYERIAPCKTEIEGVTVVLPHPDARFLEEIVSNGCYTSPEGFEIRRQDTVVDLGANVGVFTILAAIRAHDGRVISIEPEEESFRYLCENVAANSFTHVEPFRLAVSGADGHTQLSVSNPGNNHILTKSPAKKQAQTEIVETTSLPSLFSRLNLPRVDLVKMDIEGAEFLAFEEHSWLENVERIAMEAHPDLGNIDTIRKRLEEHGFSVEITPAYDAGMLYVFGRRE